MTIATPSIENLEVARTKGAALKAGEQIFLTAQDHTYIVMRWYDGRVFIAWDVDSKCGKFFKNRPVETMENNVTKEITMYYQVLSLR